MNYWKQQQLIEEDEWLKNLNPFMRIIDSHTGFIFLYCILIPISFGIGFLIGLIW